MTTPAAERPNWPLFAVMAAVAGVVLIWAGRGASFTPDELTWFAQSPDLDLHGLLEPHVGHLLLTTRLVYKSMFELFGVDYAVFRVLTLFTVIVAGALFYAWTTRRIGPIAALAPTAILLVFGADYSHMLLGNGFTVVGSVACGVGALVALDRGDRRGDAIACALLCLGVVTYTTALAFVVGIGVWILLGSDRWRRIWIVAVPVAIYGAWWLWSLGEPSSSDSQVELSNVLLFPSWAFQSLAANLSAISGLDYPFTDETSYAAGTVLALVVLAALLWRLRRGAVPGALWAVIATAGAFWLLGAVSASEFREPGSGRYLYPGSAIVLLTCAAAAAGLLPRTRTALVAIFAVAAVGIATNVAQLRDGGDDQRAFAAITGAEIGGLAVAGAAADPEFVPEGGSTTLRFALITLRDVGLSPTASFLEASGEYGVPGDPPDELGTHGDGPGAGADATLIGALGLALEPADADPSRLDCVDLAPGADLEVEPGETAILAAGGQAATVSVRRFATSTDVELGSIPADAAASFAPPADGASQPWHVTTSAPVQACGSS
jgi:hypothetical protein